MFKKNTPYEREYATCNGFYVGDTVRLPDGRKGCIDEIVLRNVNIHVNNLGYTGNYTVVRIDDELWTDYNLTRLR